MLPVSSVPLHVSSGSIYAILDRLDLEVKRNQTEHQCFEVLHQVVKNSQSLRVSRFGHIDQGSNFGRLEIDVLAAEFDLQLLPPVFVFLWPLPVVFPVYLSVAMFSLCVVRQNWLGRT